VVVVYTQKMKKQLATKISGILRRLNEKGQKIVTEEQLAKLLGVSRTPVREALQGLEKEGFLVRLRRKGISINKPSLKEITEIHDLRALLEGYAGRLFAEKKINGADLKELEKLAVRHEKALTQADGAAAEMLDELFHGKIAQLSGNSFLLRILGHFNILHRTFQISYALQLYPRIEDSPYTHRKIIEILRGCDPDECERILWSHVQWAKQRWIEMVLDTKVNHVAGRG